MNNQSAQNKKAWEYRAYEFWNKKFGSPSEKARQILLDPLAELKKHRTYFQQISGKKIANICGSNGRKAVPLSLLGADVTVFDISEENKKYAMELASYANTRINYVVTDIYEIDLGIYKESYDILYLEGGILHYFHNIEQLMAILYSLLRTDGKMILSDYHPVKRCIIKNDNDNNFYFQPSYFNNDIYDQDIAFKRFFDKADQQAFPTVSLRHFTLSEIINSVISSGFQINRFDEHLGWSGENIPWEFTLLASK